MNQSTPDQARVPAPAAAARRKETTTTTTRLGRRDDRSHATADAPTRTGPGLDDLPNDASPVSLVQQQDVPISGTSPELGRRRRRRRKRSRESLTKVDYSKCVHENGETPTVANQASGDICRMDRSSTVPPNALQRGATTGINVDKSKTDISSSACNVEADDQPRVTTLTSKDQSMSTKGIADIFDKLNDWTKDGNTTDCKVLAVTTRQARLRQQQDDNAPSPVLRPVVDSSFQWTENNIKNAQLTDPVLGQVIRHLKDGTRPTEDDIEENFTLRSFSLEWDSLTLCRDIAYRRYFDVYGQTHHLQLLIPNSLLELVCKLVHISEMGLSRVLGKHIFQLGHTAYFPSQRTVMHVAIAR